MRNTIIVILLSTVMLFGMLEHTEAKGFKRAAPPGIYNGPPGINGAPSSGGIKAKVFKRAAPPGIYDGPPGINGAPSSGGINAEIIEKPPEGRR
ncbi:collagen alpha-1(III) chain-like [Lytechinus variegatus]|uniref:collagen alpha-1(III) chain-like n=1 Tax=Lytechinus variegatus TaxID=7654 RepID=UPI001BB2C0C3|nr:collagen alpha-1(III) chain-like [Lytechinus variegatus]